MFCDRLSIIADGYAESRGKPLLSIRDPYELLIRESSFKLIDRVRFACPPDNLSVMILNS